jgi:hypothetical protein
MAGAEDPAFFPHGRGQCRLWLARRWAEQRAKRVWQLQNM